jgi:hypothetical protein
MHRTSPLLTAPSPIADAIAELAAYADEDELAALLLALLDQDDDAGDVVH